LKYRLVTDLAEEFISLIQNSLLVNNSVLIPIPLHPSRLRERGFNQAEILGRLLSKKLNITMRTDILKRARETVPQAEIERRKDRMENMKNVFVCNDVFHQQAERYKNILLFDDVFTTGTTMREATSVLKRAGARWVWCVTMAR
jgi:ComF family protein